MGHIRYTRYDIDIRIRRLPDGDAKVITFACNQFDQFTVPSVEVDDWMSALPSAPFTDMLDSLRPIRDLLIAMSGDIVQQAQQTQWFVPRIILKIDDLDLAALPWESTLSQWLPQQDEWLVIVRSSLVHCAWEAKPLALPITAMHVEPTPDWALDSLTQAVFGSHDSQRVARAINVKRGNLERIEAGKRGRLEILQFEQLRFPTGGRLLQSTSQPTIPGTLGWLTRLTERLECRLVVLAADGPEQTRQARWLAAALIARGGPAVVVADRTEPNYVNCISEFYKLLIHNFPMDDALRRAVWGVSPQPMSLFAGAQREEALRFSRIAEHLSSFAQRCADRGSVDEDEYIPLFNIYQPFHVPRWHIPATQQEQLLPLFDDQREAFRRFADVWEDLKFEEHEVEGLLPLADSIGEFQKEIGKHYNISWLYDWDWSRHDQQQQAYVGPQQSTELPMPKRYVNGAFWEEGEEGDLLFLEPAGARLSCEQVYHLEVYIGPRDIRVVSVGTVALPESVFEWTSGHAVRVEVAVTGLDFEVIGDPVRELWLPRKDSSRSIYFPVIARATPVACLRICLYHKQNVIQTFRVGASTTSAYNSLPELPPHEYREAIASALAVSPDDVGDAGYLMRLEYSLTTSADGIESKPARNLSIVANDHDGEPVITIKSADAFTVERPDYELALPGALKDRVHAVRTALTQIATENINGQEQYRFGLAGDPNRGDASLLSESVSQLAAVGWALYHGIFPSQASKEGVAQALGDGGVVHVAHMLLEKVIPWAAIYDRAYDVFKREDENGNPVAHEACNDILDLPLDELTKVRCGQHPKCKLHPDNLRQRAKDNRPSIVPETVACPLHFWGFRHVIEIPAQQVDPKKRKAHEQHDCIGCQRPVKFTAGIHRGLNLAEVHETKLTQLCARQSVNTELSLAARRDRVLNLLGSIYLDVVYLYCHAQGGDAASPTGEPMLEFMDKDDAAPGWITPSQLYGADWRHHPLVFLNGCETVGFSPEALSPFVTALCARGGAGVIGTETSVWEALADEFALMFMEDFLEGINAGEALKRARLSLLQKNNPLGLVYTLYAASELALDTDFDGKCK